MSFLKTYLWFFVVCLLGCTQKIDYKNLDFTPHLSYESSGDVIINQPISLRCILQSLDDLSGEGVKITLTEQNTFVGQLKYGDILLLKGRSFDYYFSQPLLLTFTPTTSGSHDIIIDCELGPEKIKRTAKISITVSAVNYGVTLLDVPDSFIAGKDYPMKLGIELGNTSVPSSPKIDLQLSVSMPQGKGIVKIKNNTIFDNSQGSLSVPFSFNSFSDQTKANSFPLTSDEIADITFCPITAGENKIFFTVRDKYSNSTSTPFTFFTSGANIIVTDNLKNFKIKYETPVNFALSIDHLTYKGSYQVNIDNSAINKGVLSSSNAILIWGTALSNISNGVHNYKFTSQEVGLNSITYKVTFINESDKQEYTTIHEIPFTVEPYPLMAVLKDFSALTVNRLEEVNFKLDIQEEKSPTTPFKVSYSYIKGAGSIKVNGSALNENKEITVNSGIQSISYVPTEPGEHSLIFSITDMFNQKMELPYKLPVINNTLDAILTQPKDSYINVPVSFSITASQKGYSGKYFLTYTSNKSGILKFPDGSVLTPNVKIELPTPAVTLNYTGTEVGNHNLAFTITDDYGQTIKRTTTLAIKKPHITIISSAAKVSSEIDTPANFSLKIGAEGYVGQFRLTATGGTSAITVDNTNINNATILVPSGTIAVSYTPTTVNTHPLKFTITDDYGQTASALVSVEGTHKTMVFSASFASGTHYLGRPTELHLAASGAEPFTVQYNGGIGRLLKNETIIEQGTPVTLLNSDKWFFLSSKEGLHNLTFTATDKNGQKKTASASLMAVTSEILISLSKNNNNTLINTPTTSTLNLSNSANDDKFTVRWKCAQGGTLNIITGNEYPKGSLGLEYTPNSTPGIKQIELTVEDKFGTSKSLIWTVTASYANINASLTAPNVYAEHLVDITYTVSKEQYNGSYYISATSNRKGLIHSNTVASGTHKISYIPTSVLDNLITLTITDDQNGKIVKEQEIIISYPDLKYTRVYQGIGEELDPRKTYIYTIIPDNYISPTFSVSLEKNSNLSYGSADLTVSKINDLTYKIQYRGSGFNGESRWQGNVVITDKFNRSVKHSENVFFPADIPIH